MFTECDFGPSPLCVTLIKQLYTDGAVIVKNHAICTIVGLGLLCAAVISGEISAAIINVPGDQPTIQAAVDAADSGDTITIAAGAFWGPGNRDIDFAGKELTVRGQGPRVTVIDCGGSEGDHHGAFYLHTSEDSSSISGIEITGGYFGTSFNDKGVITCWGSSPVISDCLIRFNHAHGIAINGVSAPELSNVQISANAGWGIWMPGYPYLSHGFRVTGSVVDHNGLGGITVSTAVDSTFVVGNTIADNGGTGLYLQGDLPEQSASSVWDTAVFVEQNIIAFNGSWGIYKLSFFPGIHYYGNDVFGNTRGNWPGIGADTVCVLTADPIFCRQQGGGSEYALGTNSPCLAANNQCGVAMGAFGQGCTTCCVGFPGNVDCDPKNQIDISDLTRMIDFLYVSFSPLCCFDGANMDGSGAIDIADLTALIDYLYLSLVAPPNCFGG